MSNEIISAMIERRSVKKYSQRAVERETLEEIMRAASYAANGKAWQSPIMIAVSDPSTREMLRRLNATVLGNPDSDPFYGAPTVVVVLADSERFTYVEDGSLVIGNMMLAAHSLGVDSCWIHRARQMFEGGEGREWLRSIGVEDKYVGIGNCILGYRADGVAPVAKPRKSDYYRFI